MNDFFQNTNAKKTLANRAALIAVEKKENSSVAKSSILIFEVDANQKYGIAYDAIDKVISYQKVTPIPGVNSLFSGLIYHNAEVWPIVNSNELFGSKKSPNHLNFILLQSGGYRYGLAVGKIVGTHFFDEADELIHFPVKNDNQSNFVQGIYHNEIALVNITAVFTRLNAL